MGVPKRRASKHSIRTRRSHHKARLPALGKCPQCGAVRQMHRVCPACGYYRGRQVVTVEVD